MLTAHSTGAVMIKSPAVACAKNPSSITHIDLATTVSTVIHSDKRHQGLTDNSLTKLPLYPTYESHSAKMMLEIGIIEALFLGESGIGAGYRLAHR